MAAITVPDYAKGATLEDVWAALRDVAERQKETDRQMQETDRRQKETDRQMQETDRRLKKTERLVAKNSKQMGGLHNSLGDLAEHFFAPGAARRFNEIGFHFTEVSPGGRIFRDEQTGKIKTEVDILLENGETIMAVEVKAKLGKDDIEHHARRLEIMRKIYGKKGDKRKLYGAVALAVCREPDRGEVLGAGFYLLEQSGDTVKLEVPEGFVAREW